MTLRRNWRSRLWARLALTWAGWLRNGSCCWFVKSSKRSTVSQAAVITQHVTSQLCNLCCVKYHHNSDWFFWPSTVIRTVLFFRRSTGMFTYDRKSRVFWFSSNPCENYQGFHLVGVVSFCWTSVSLAFKYCQLCIETFGLVLNIVRLAFICSKSNHSVKLKS